MPCHATFTIQGGDFYLLHNQRLMLQKTEQYSHPYNQYHCFMEKPAGILFGIVVGELFNDVDFDEQTCITFKDS